MDRLTANFEKRIAKNDLSSWQRNPPGFSCWIYLHGLDAALCVDNYRKSSFDGLPAYKEERFLERIPMNHVGMDKVRNFKALYTLWSAADSLDLCIFAVASTRTTLTY